MEQNLTVGEMESNTIEATDETSTDSDTTENISTPSFGDADVQAYVDAYDAYLTDYKKALENKDMEAFAALATKGQDLGNKAQEISGKVSGSDAERLAAYMTKKATEIQELSKKMME